MMPAMRLPRRPVLFALFALLFALTAGAAFYESRAAQYDYLALALSWSPTHCVSEAGRDDEGQCAAGSRHGFVVHGLWPEFDRGWPEYCASSQNFVPGAVIAQMRDLMPSKSLVIHEWKRHGTCSGLSPRGYFAATRRLYSRLTIPARYRAPKTALIVSPDQLVADFLTANPRLSPGMMSVRCESERAGARLKDVVFCFSRDFESRPCGANQRQGCAAPELTLPPVR